VINVARMQAREIKNGPYYDANFLLQSFIAALQSVETKGYQVQGAIYGPEQQASIFIYTEDEDWVRHVKFREDAMISAQ